MFSFALCIISSQTVLPRHAVIQILSTIFIFLLLIRSFFLFVHTTFSHFLYHWQCCLLSLLYRGGPYWWTIRRRAWAASNQVQHSHTSANTRIQLAKSPWCGVACVSAVCVGCERDLSENLWLYGFTALLFGVRSGLKRKLSNFFGSVFPIERECEYRIAVKLGVSDVSWKAEGQQV